jgi:hypothetical protein
MNGKWSGNSFLLGPSSLANHGWLAQLLFSLTYLLTTHKTNSFYVLPPFFFFIYGDGKPLESPFFFEFFNFQFRFLAIFHQQKKRKKLLPTFLPTYQLRGSIGPWYPVPFATLEEEAGLGERRRRGRRR